MRARRPYCVTEVISRYGRGLNDLFPFINGTTGSES
jgi:hypothetical protein